MSGPALETLTLVPAKGIGASPKALKTSLPPFELAEDPAAEKADLTEPSPEPAPALLLLDADPEEPLLALVQPGQTPLSHALCTSIGWPLPTVASGLTGQEGEPSVPTAEASLLQAGTEQTGPTASGDKAAPPAKAELPAHLPAPDAALEIATTPAATQATATIPAATVRPAKANTPPGDSLSYTPKTTTAEAGIPQAPATGAREMAPFRMDVGSTPPPVPAESGKPPVVAKAETPAPPVDQPLPSADVQILQGPENRLDVLIRAATPASADRLTAAKGELEMELAAIGTEVEAIAVELRGEHGPDGGAEGQLAEGALDRFRAEWALRPRGESTAFETTLRDGSSPAAPSENGQQSGFRRESEGRAMQEQRSGNGQSDPSEKQRQNGRRDIRTAAAPEASSARIDRYA